MVIRTSRAGGATLREPEAVPGVGDVSGWRRGEPEGGWGGDGTWGGRCRLGREDVRSITACGTLEAAGALGTTSEPSASAGALSA